MSSAEIWEFLNRYKEFITNGLDLVSFVLVAPRLLRLLAPAVKQVTLFVFLAFEVIMMGILCWGLWKVSGTFSNSTTIRILISFGIYCVVFPILLYPLTAFPKVMEKAANDMSSGAIWFTRQAFIFGVATFLISRIIAFAVAAHQLQGGL
jgi:hypothetical protein